METRTERLGPADHRFRPGQGPDDAERAAMTAAIAEIDDRLDRIIPDDGGRVVERIAEQVRASFAARETGVTPATIYDGFLIALPGRSAPAASEAVRRILRSEAPPDYSRVYQPKPGELAALTKAIEGEWRLERDRLKRLLRLPVQTRALTAREPDASPEEVARARAVLDRMRKAREDRQAAMTAGAEARSRTPGLSPAARVAALTAGRRAASEGKP